MAVIIPHVGKVDAGAGLPASVGLQFSTQRDLGSWAIRLFSHSPFSHVDLVMPDGRLLGARTDGGVRIREPGYASFAKRRIVELASPAAPAVYAAALSQVGKPYDWRAIVGFAFDRDWRDDNAWFCSEFVAWALEKGGFWKKPLALPNTRITPGDLLLVVSAS